jgi:multicomponent Na+:H+ antiporter subunit G
MIREILALAMLLVGLTFCTLGVVGVLRLPDVYTRLHASGKVATLGIFGLLMGASLLMPEIAPKALALGLFLLFSSPVTSHAISGAAYQAGAPMVGAVRDDLRGKKLDRETEEFPA